MSQARSRRGPGVVERCGGGLQLPSRPLLLDPELLAQRVHVLQAGELGRGLASESYDRLDRVAVLAPQVVDQPQPLFHRRAFLGVDLHLLSQRGRIPCQLGCLGHQRGPARRQRGETLIVRRG